MPDLEPRLIAQESEEEVEREARLRLDECYRQVTEDTLGRMWISGRGYAAALLAAAGLMGIGVVSWGLQLWFGIGLSGLQHPIMWATYITNFVWWIGVAHSGTIISALLFLARAPFRPMVSRFSEAFGVIAMITAAAYPVIHLGRAWRFYWLLPYPNQRDLWVTFRSPLVLDVFAVMTDLVVALAFLWMGLLPDLAVVRDRSRGWRRTIYGLLSLGWQGTGRQWKHHRMAYSILAVLVAVFIIGSHSVVAWDFSLSIVPAWHGTLLPPYFVVAAILSGFAILLMVLIPTRSLLRLEAYITRERLEWVAWLLVAASLLITFANLLDYSIVWISGRPIERVSLANQIVGSFAPYFWGAVFCNSLAPLALLWRRVRRNLLAVFVISAALSVGLWLERFVIIAGGLARDYLPYAWAQEGYRILLVEWGISLGSVGWFLFAYLLFIRYVPVFPLAELRDHYRKEHKEALAIRAARLGNGA